MANNMSRELRYQHESADVSERSIVWIAFGLIVILIFIGVIVFSLFIYFGGSRSTAPDRSQVVVEEKQGSPPPHLEVKPGVSLQKLRKEKENLLHSYGWIDKEKGTVHIPIERAMELLAEGELPTHTEKSRKLQQERR